MTYQIRQFGKPTTLNNIIEYTIIQLAKHPLVNGDAGVRDDDNKPVRISKFRNFSGVELKEQALTLSVFPYSYEGSSKPTPESKNTSISFMPYGLMGVDPSKPSTKSIDFATANIKIRLDMLGYTLKDVPQSNTLQGQRGLFGTTVGVQTFETNQAERILRDYIEYIRLALISDLFNLHGMIRGSSVNWVDHISTSWDKAGNLILHTAELMWQVYYNPLRSWRVDAPVITRDTLIGAYYSDGAPVFWRPDLDVLVTGFGQAILKTPSGLPISWRPWTVSEGDGIPTFYNPQTNEILSQSALYAPNSTTGFINLDLLPVMVLIGSDIPLYFNKTTNQLVKYDGTAFNKIPGPNAALNADGTLNLNDQSNWIPVAWDPESSQLVYGVGHPDVGNPVQIADLSNPATGDLYLTAGQIHGISSSISPTIREFVQFPAPSLALDIQTQVP